MNSNRKYRGFEIVRNEVKNGCFDSGTGAMRTIEFVVIYGPDFPPGLRGCAVLPTAGARTWMEAKESIDLLVHIGVTPDGDPQAFRKNCHEMYALDRELRFERALAANQFLPLESKFHKVRFIVKAISYDKQAMVIMPEYDKRTGHESTFTIPMERFPKKVRPFVKAGESFYCLCNLSSVDMQYGHIRPARYDLYMKTTAPALR